MKFAFLIEPPFNFRRSDGRVAGCDVDLARHVLAEIGAADFEPVETEFAFLLPGLAKGRWTMTTGLFATEERRAHAAFSRPIWALPDGLLVPRGNPLDLSGYRSIAVRGDSRLAVIRDQFQHRSAVSFGVPEDRILVFETYSSAARAVLSGDADAYASVARAHSGYIERAGDVALEVVEVAAEEKPPAYGCFGFAKEDTATRNAVDTVLAGFLGTPRHRAMMAGYGFTDAEIDPLVR